MIIDEELIKVRREELETEMKNLQEQHIANVNAFRGAIQQCDIFLEDLNDEKPEMASDGGNDEE